METQVNNTNQYSKKLIMLNKNYKDKDKFCSIGNDFNFKVIIFNDKYKRVTLPLNTYIYGTSIMLSSLTQIYYNTNCGDISTFDKFCINI